MKKIHKINENIYITSDEEIKEGDWVINLNSPYAHKELCRIDNQLELERYAKKTSNNCKKIILTTDPDLIADGIQAIDYEFLEWFVQNQNCKFVKVKFNEFEVDMGLGESCVEYGSYYEIIIPQEEYTSQDFLNQICWSNSKQETIEDALLKYLKNRYYKSSDSESFIAGAKWQAERMYSEEDVQNLIKIIEWYDDNSDVRPNWDRIIDGLTMFEWFEKFKKK